MVLGAARDWAGGRGSGRGWAANPARFRKTWLRAVGVSTENHCTPTAPSPSGLLHLKTHSASSEPFLGTPRALTGAGWAHLQLAVSVPAPLPPHRCPLVLTSGGPGRGRAGRGGAHTGAVPAPSSARSLLRSAGWPGPLGLPRRGKRVGTGLRVVITSVAFCLRSALQAPPN